MDRRNRIDADERHHETSLAAPWSMPSQACACKQEYRYAHSFIVSIGASDGTPIYPAVAVPVPTVQGPVPNYLAPVPGRGGRSSGAPPSQTYIQPAAEPVAPMGPAAPASLQARLYPSNEVATETGMLSGTVTNMMTGKGSSNSTTGARFSRARRRAFLARIAAGWRTPTVSAERI